MDANEQRDVSPASARAALDAMDDFARMDCAVNAIGARETLAAYIRQQEALAQQVPADGEPAAWMDWAGGIIPAAWKKRDPEAPYPIPLYATPQAPQPVVDGVDAEMAQQAADEVNPAWWRGNDAAVAILCQKIQAILDGKDDGRGVASEPWESTRRRLLATQPQQGAVAHQWDADGERCLRCGDKDWMGGPCNPPTIGQQAVDEGMIERALDAYVPGGGQVRDYDFPRFVLIAILRAALAAHGKGG